ncbi:MAG: hypothetical protein F9K40_12570 [Kofleriaceae bacterium]|nr:MAG: hypothetical protein F9K40_12570 [Kofleriaceae bacterium]MBZ0237850.1 hypothetical protein [Kofleriaceae bacterium]
MEPAPPLRPATPPAPASFFAQHALGLAAIAIGLVAFVVATFTQDALWSMPDWRITVPFLLAAAVATVVSFARREGMPYLPLVGLGLAAVSVVLGWFLVMAAIVVVTAIIILIMSAVM